MSNIDLGQQLKNYRKTKKYSMAKVQEITGIKADKMYKWEKGTKPSDADELLKLREFLSGKLETKPKSDTPVDTLQPNPAPIPDGKDLVIGTLVNRIEPSLNDLRGKIAEIERIVKLNNDALLRLEAAEGSKGAGRSYKGKGSGPV